VRQSHQFLGCRFVAFCAHRSRLHCQARDSAYIPASGLPNLGQQWQRQEDCADKLPSSPASGRRAGAGAPSDAADRLGPMAPPSAISGSPWVCAFPPTAGGSPDAPGNTFAGGAASVEALVLAARFAQDCIGTQWELRNYRSTFYHPASAPLVIENCTLLDKHFDQVYVVCAAPHQRPHRRSRSVDLDVSYTADFK
jgi:hypothetical protein